MKTKEKDSLRTLSLPELRAELRTTREKRMRLLFKHRMTPVPNPLELRELRRRIARLETFIRQKGPAGERR